MNNLAAKSLIFEINKTAKAENTRVTNTTNIALNTKIFSMIKQAIPIVAQVEEYCNKINQHEYVIFCELKKNAWKAIHTLLLLLGNIAAIFGVLKIGNISFSLAQDTIVLEGVTLWLFEVLILFVMIMILAKIGKRIHDKSFEAKHRRQIQRIEKEREQYIIDHQYELLIVPPKYASSVKLSYMYDFYVQGQADNMKEALRLADTKSYREDELRSLNYIGQCVTNLITTVDGFDSGYWWPGIDEYTA